MKRLSLAFAILVLVLWPALSWAEADLWNAENYHVELEGRYWRPRLNSTVKIVDGNVGTDLSLVDDLGFAQEKDFGEGRVQVKFFQRHKFNFSYLPLRWEGSRVQTRTIIFNGQVFNVGTRVESHLDMQFIKAGYEYDFLAGKYGFLGASFDILMAPTEIELKAPTEAIVQKHNVILPAAMVGLVGRLNFFRWLGLTAKVSGLPAGDYGFALDTEASLDVNPIKYVGISGGYRIFEVKASLRGNSADYKLEGPFLALKVRF